MLDITVADGKYRVIQDEQGNLKAYRYGEEWRDCTGDGLIYSLASEIDDLREALKEVEKNEKKRSVMETIETAKVFCDMANVCYVHGAEVDNKQILHQILKRWPELRKKYLYLVVDAADRGECLLGKEDRYGYCL